MAKRDLKPQFKKEPQAVESERKVPENLGTVPEHELTPARELAKETNSLTRQMGDIAQRIEILAAEQRRLSQERLNKEAELGKTIESLCIRHSAKSIDIGTGKINELMTSQELKNVAERLAKEAAEKSS